jgi:hypothetical protein
MKSDEFDRESASLAANDKAGAKEASENSQPRTAQLEPESAESETQSATGKVQVEPPASEDQQKTKRDEASPELFVSEPVASGVKVAPGVARLSLAEEEEGGEEEEEEGQIIQGEEDLEHVQDDPLAPAYDLERGTLLDKQQPGNLPWRSDVRTAKEFFNTELLYRFDILERHHREQIAGRYRIELKGYQGGVWSIIIGDDMEVVNRKEDAEIVLIMQQRDFLQMINGHLNPQLAILGNKMKIVGDVKKAVWFQSMLYPTIE